MAPVKLPSAGKLARHMTNKWNMNYLAAVWQTTIIPRYETHEFQKRLELAPGNGEDKDKWNQ